MIKVYKDNSIYVGEMNSQQRDGIGTLYLLDDFFAGYKVSSDWQDDKLNGYATISTKTYTESGLFVNGIQTGCFSRIYNNGKCSSIRYNNGINESEEVFAHNDNTNRMFGCIQLSESQYYVGDIYNGNPFGYGMFYDIDVENNIVSKTFGKIYGRSLVQWIELTNNVYEDENTSAK